MFTTSILGWGEPRQHDLDSLSDPGLVPARVASVERGAITVLGALPDPLAPVVVPSRAPAGLESPAVGDWVALRPSAGTFVLDCLLPRTSLFVRKEAGRGSAAQPVAANVDRVLVVTAVGDDLSPGRIERYVTAIVAGGAAPILVVNKADRPHDAGAVLSSVRSAAPEVPVVSISAATGEGVGELLSLVPPPMTVVLVGSSGVGKTTLTNRLHGEAARPTAEVRAADDKGRHTTTRRELVVTPAGLLVIDTPGVRELGLWDASAGLSAAFPDITELAAECRFTDCAHAVEPGCAVRAAIERGTLPAARAERHARLTREIAHNDARSSDQQSRDRKQRWKAVHKSQRERQKLERKLGLKGW